MTLDSYLVLTPTALKMGNLSSKLFLSHESFEYPDGSVEMRWEEYERSELKTRIDEIRKLAIQPSLTTPRRYLEDTMLGELGFVTPSHFRERVGNVHFISKKVRSLESAGIFVVSERPVVKTSTSKLHKPPELDPPIQGFRISCHLLKPASSAAITKVTDLISKWIRSFVGDNFPGECLTNPDSCELRIGNHLLQIAMDLSGAGVRIYTSLMILLTKIFELTPFALASLRETEELMDVELDQRGKVFRTFARTNSIIETWGPIEYVFAIR